MTGSNVTSIRRWPDQAGGFFTRLICLLSFVSLPLWEGNSCEAAVRISAGSGHWNQSSTWVGGVVPGPGDEATIAGGHQVVFRGPENPEEECSRLTIQAGGELVLSSQKALTFLVGGNGPGIRGGIEILGRMVVSAGTTVAIDPDGNASTEEDGVTVHPGGSLTLLGHVIHEGTVSVVLSDDDASTIHFTDAGLHLGANAPSLKVVWRSGLRKGRWYDILTSSTGEMVLDSRSRSNSERTGEPDYGDGTASVTGITVTGAGTAWTDAMGSGSWWWCDADGQGRKVRVRRVDSPTSLQLVRTYGPSACSLPGAYTLRDENQPYPAVDWVERVASGDRYSVILPATLRSFQGADDTFDEQIFLRVAPGGTYHFENASFQSLGKEAWQNGEGSGIQISGFRGPAASGVFNTVEIYRYGGDAAIEWEDSSDFDVDWLFLHWAHPLITTSNEGHGLKIEHTSPASSADNVRIRNARFDRTNDDFVWWASTAGGTSGIYDSIGRYCPNTASGDSCDAVDTNDEIGRTGGQLRIERNLFTNIGAKGGGSCVQASRGPNTQVPGWTGDGWVARDNICLNLQSVPCMDTFGGGYAWDREQIWAVNNVCVGVHDNGIKGIPHVLQNEILNFGTQRRSGVDGLRGAYEARGNIFWGVGRRRPGDTYFQRGVGIGFNLVGEANWAGTSWSLTDNIILVSGAGIVANSWSSTDFPSSGDARISHNTLLGNPLDTQNVPMTGIVDVHTEPSDAGIVVTDNIFDFLLARDSKAGIGFDGAWRDRIASNVVNSPYFPYWGGVLDSVTDHPVSTGIVPYFRILGPQPGSGAWTIATTDGDKPGPRFAGTLSGRLPFQVPELVPVVDPDDDDLDRDGDALIDRWDNCPDIPNPGWADSDGNGVGNACEL